MDSVNASSEKSHQYRNEASASLQKSESFSKMASWTQQNAGSINANVNQEYVNWLQTQSLPNSRGPMGITEAETILSSRPDLDHAYQKRFLSEKMGQMEDHFGVYGLSSSTKGIDQAFEHAQQKISPPPEKAFLTVKGQATQQGFGVGFQVSKKAKDDANDRLSLIFNQLIQQKDTLEQQAKTHKKDVEQSVK